MTKRASGKYPRNPRDFYATPSEAVVPLLPHLSGISGPAYYDEPCCGSGALIHCLSNHGHICASATDKYPVEQYPMGGPPQSSQDALALLDCLGDMFITNPPWSRPILHKLIVHLSDITPTWLLFDADWMHTKQSIPFMSRCVKIVSVGRVSWMGNGTVGFDNCAWYMFDKHHTGVTAFFGRVK